MNIFNLKDWANFSNIIKAFYLKFTLNTIGALYLSQEEQKLLKSVFGKDILSSDQVSSLDKAYLLGKVSIELGDDNFKDVSYSHFKEWLKNSPHSKRVIQNIKEENLSTLKKQAYLDIAGLEFKTLKDIRQLVLQEENKLFYQGKNLTLSNIKEIANNVMKAIPTWEKEIDSSVSYISNSVFQQGRLDQIVEKYGENTLVYKMPQPNACKYCISLYLTNGVGSKPRVFEIKELYANGTNIGRKPNDWKATYLSLHVHCRCLLNYVDKETEWDDKEQRFLPKKEGRRVKRESKVYITLNNKTFEV